MRCGSSRPSGEEAIRHLFGVKGLLDGVDSDMFDFLLCKVDHGFGHVQFKVGDDMTVARFVLSMGDRFYSSNR